MKKNCHPMDYNFINIDATTTILDRYENKDFN